MGYVWVLYITITKAEYFGVITLCNVVTICFFSLHIFFNPTVLNYQRLPLKVMYYMTILLLLCVWMKIIIIYPIIINFRYIGYCVHYHVRCIRKSFVCFSYDEIWVKIYVYISIQSFSFLDFFLFHRENVKCVPSTYLHTGYR